MDPSGGGSADPFRGEPSAESRARSMYTVTFGTPTPDTPLTTSRSKLWGTTTSPRLMSSVHSTETEVLPSVTVPTIR